MAPSAEHVMNWLINITFTFLVVVLGGYFPQNGSNPFFWNQTQPWTNCVNISAGFLFVLFDFFFFPSLTESDDVCPPASLAGRLEAKLFLDSHLEAKKNKNKIGSQDSCGLGKVKAKPWC